LLELISWILAKNTKSAKMTANVLHIMSWDGASCSGCSTSYIQKSSKFFERGENLLQNGVTLHLGYKAIVRNRVG